MNQETIDFPVIDAHVHLYPDAIAAKIVPELARRFGNPQAFDGTVEGCRRKNLADCISAAVNLPVATKPDSINNTNRFWANHLPQNEAGMPSAVVSLAAFHPLVEDKGRALEKIAADGFAGVKMHPEYQRFRLDDKGMDDAWAAMSELGLVAYLHAGGERVFDPPYRSTPADVVNLHKRFPDLKIVAAHLGGFGMWDDAERIIIGTGIHLDLSHTFFWVPHEQLLRMIRKHGAERLLFGSDAPWQDAGKILEAFMALPLTYRERRLICHDNAAELLNIKLTEKSK